MSSRSRRQRQTTLSSRVNQENTPQAAERKSSKNSIKKPNTKGKGALLALSTLQLDANDETLLVGGSKTPIKTPKRQKSRRSPLSPHESLFPELPLEIEKQPQSDACTQTESLKFFDKGTQTTPVKTPVDDEKEKEEEQQKLLEYRMMACEEPPLEYYKIMAEKHRLALVDTLRENEQLYEEIEALKSQVKASERHRNDSLYFQFMYRLASDDSTL